LASNISFFQLRYYDPDDQQCKGRIDLADVTGITAVGGLSFEVRKSSPVRQQTMF
jgi:hypothetical protein